jgi:proteasome-associated ATPase
MKAKSEREKQLEQRVLDLQTTVSELDAFAKSVTSPPLINGIITHVGETTLDVAGADGKSMEVAYSNQIQRDDLKIGAGVSMNPENLTVLRVRDTPLGGGIYSTVSEVLDDGRVVIKEGGQSHVLSVADGLELTSGDRITCDKGFNVALDGLGKGTSRFDLNEVPETPWESLGGLDTEIADIRRAIEEPYEHKELYAKYGRRPSKGVLLKGPPGCGKTHLARATAYNLSQRLGTGKGFFLELGGPEIKDPFYGVSEGMVREFFARGREISENNGDVAIGFIDEADALFPRRGYGNAADTSVTDAFLYEMDGLANQSGFVLMLATNREYALDSAVTRRGRIDDVINVGRPNRDAAESIFKIYLENSFLNGVDAGDLAAKATRNMYGGGYHLFDVNYAEGTGAPLDFDNQQPIHLRDLSSGSLIEAMVYQAADIAMRRELDGSEVDGGIGESDLIAAIGKEYGIHRRMEFTPEYVNENLPSSRSRKIVSITAPHSSGRN